METGFSIDQFTGAYPDGIECHWWSMARSEIIADVINAFAEPKSLVLEVGCGRGIVVKSLRDAGIECFGVELSEIHPIAAAEKYVRTGTSFAELTITERQRYDTILLLDVIEHIAEPVSFLQDIADSFPNLSYIIVTVPARQELWSNYDEVYGHYRRYTAAMLDRVSSNLGWSLKLKSYFFHLVYFPAIVLATLKKKRKTKLEPPQGLNKLMHRLIARAMVIDYYLLPRRLVGTSIIGCFCLQKEHCSIK